MSEGQPAEGLFDENGFLKDPDTWDREQARQIAAALGVGDLGEEHWGVIDHIRGHYLEHGSLPWMEHVCRDLELDQRCFHRLFGGPVEAWKVAGLPDPGEEARVYMENEEPD